MLNHLNIFRKLFTIMTVVSLLTGSALLAAPVLADSIITVTTTDDNTNSDGFCSLREAIINANDDAQTFTGCPAGSGNDTISFDNALGTATVTITSALPLISDTDGLVIDGGSDIRVSGDNLYQVLYVFPSASLALQNLTIINGKSSTGGGVYNGGSVTITNTTFTNNISTIHGGGIFNDGTLTVTNSLFLNNNATSAGGGIINNSSGTILVKNSTFIGNTAASAGAIYQNDSGTLSITNSTFADNTAVNYGGSIYSTGATTVTNSTFSSNGAGLSGSDILFSTFASPTLSLYNNILANSDTNTGSCAVLSGTVLGNNNLIEDATSACGFTNSTNGNIVGSDPALGLLTGSPAYFPLSTGSPAINTGNDAVCAAAPVNGLDQRGTVRPFGAHCDIGAVEYVSIPLAGPWIGSVSISSDKNVVAVGRPHIGAEITSYDGFSSGALSAYVPMLFKDAFGGSYDAALYVQNVSASSASLTIKFYDSSGTLSCTKNDTVSSLASKGYWLPSESCLPSGWVGGALITSDQNIVAIGRPHIGAEVMTYNGFSSGSTSASIPMLFKDAFGGSYDAAFYIQNIHPSNTANLTINFYDSSGALSCTKNDTLSPLASKGYWVPAESCLPTGWVGGVIVTSDQPIVSVGRPHIGSQITTYNGFSSGSTSSFIPMLFKDAFGGSYDAAFYLQNTHSSNTANLTIQFYDSAGILSCTKNDSLAPFASKGYWVPSETCLPAGWVGGAVVTSDQPIVSVGRPHIGSQITTYNGFSSGSSSSFLSMLFKDAFGGSYDSAFYIQNTEATQATVTTKFYDSSGILTCSRTDTIQPKATLGIWLPSATCTP